MPRPLSFLLFFVVGGAILLVLHRYVHRRMVRDTGLSGRARTVASAAIIGGGVLVPLAMLLSRALPREWVGPLAIAAFCWLGAMFYLTLLLVPWDLGRAARRLFERLRRRSTADLADAATDVVVAPEGEGHPEAPPSSDVSVSRRAFVARVAAGTAAVGTLGIGAVGARNALGEITTPELSVALPRLPPALSGLRIVQITDVHIGPILDARFIDAVVEKVNALRPDVAVITGDLVDGSVALLGPEVAALSRIRARYGTFFVTGNHEYYSGAEEWVAFLDRLGIRVLMNEHVAIGDSGPGGARIHLAGIPDSQGGQFAEAHRADLPRALAGRDPDTGLVLLAHRPNPIVEAAAHGVGLQLSGHTHGGQMWPFSAAAGLTSPYVAGLHRHAPDTFIYVSRGTGFWGPPMRILAPAEITTIVLTA